MPALLRTTMVQCCREVAALVACDLEKDGGKRRPDAARVAMLLAQAKALLPSAEQLPEEDGLRPLLAASLGTLEVASGQEEAGYARFGQAAKALAMLWKARKARKGLGPDALLADLDSLSSLYVLAGLRQVPWRDEALRIRCAAAKGADPQLEKALGEVIEDHYGPWLTPVELEPTLAFCGLLARQWQREPDDRAFTERLVETGLRHDATRVWALAARKAPDGLKGELKGLLLRLDVQTVLAEEKRTQAVLDLAGTLLCTPLHPDAEQLLFRMEALARRGGTNRLALRRRIAEIRGDQAGAAAILMEELAATGAPADVRRLLAEGVLLQADAPHDGLLRLGTQCLTALAAKTGPEDTDFQELMADWIGLLRGAGQTAQALELSQCLPAATGPVAEPQEDAGAPAAPPRDAETRIRQQMAAVKEGRLKAADLRQLLQEAVASLGPGHRLVVELALLLAKNPPDPQECMAILQKTLDRMDGEETHDRVLEAECLVSLASLQGLEGQEQALDGTFQRLLRLLDTLPDPGSFKDAPGVYILGLLRAERLEEGLEVLGAWQARLLLTATPPEARAGGENEEDAFNLTIGIECKELLKLRPAMARAARFQALVRAAGLP